MMDLVSHIDSVFESKSIYKSIIIVPVDEVRETVMQLLSKKDYACSHRLDDENRYRVAIFTEAEVILGNDATLYNCINDVDLLILFNCCQVGRDDPCVCSLFEHQDKDDVSKPLVKVEI